MENLWVKVALGACSTLLTVVLALSGWGLNKVYEVDRKVDHIDNLITIWTTPVPRPPNFRDPAIRPAVYYPAGEYRGAQGADFAQKSMYLAASQLLQKDTDGALKTLLLGLEATGLKCVPAGDHLDCK
jgi:hypothetical protein